MNFLANQLSFGTAIDNYTTKIKKMIKLIWDFKGPDAERIAQHHAVHLKEFAVQHGYDKYPMGSTTIRLEHAIAFIAVPEEKMIAVRDLLRPHRGELFEPLTDN